VTGKVSGRNVRNGGARPAYTVIGAGNGGLALAGLVSLRGFEARMYNPLPQELEPVAAAGGVTLEGELTGFGPVALASPDPVPALAGAAAALVVVPATFHRLIAEQLAPHLAPGQVVCLSPGRTGGALEFAHRLRQCGCSEDVLVGEAQTFVMASRIAGPARAHVYGLKRSVPVAALPAARTVELLDRLRPVLPEFRAAADVLETGLNNMGAVMHPAPTLFNATRIDAGDRFEFYHQGVIPPVARVLESLDAERVAVAAAYGTDAMTCRRWLNEAYGSRDGELYDMIRNTSDYARIQAPPSWRHRYVTEEVPCSLVPMSDLGRLAGVPTPTIDAVIHLACLFYDTDFRARGRTLARLGLEGLDPAAVHRLVRRG